MINLFSVFFTAVVISLLFTYPVTWLKIGQPVREDVPAAHQAKAGTPTMGGIGIVSAIIVIGLILINVEFNPQYLALMLLMLAFAGIGLADDMIKTKRRQNQGLTFWQKIFWQTAAAAGFSIVLTLLGTNLSHQGWLSSFGFTNPYFYQILLVFIIVGSANATNLTDGLNGLLAGSAGIAFLAFALIALALKLPEAVTFCLISAGATLAFLYYNFPKAKLFMGDVGSLALGAALAGMAAILHKELLLIIIGGVFVIEALSVILQVVFFKLFGRRIFRMAPLHHHFELLGIKEIIVVIGFWFAALVFGLTGVFL